LLTKARALSKTRAVARPVQGEISKRPARTMLTILR